MAMETAPNGGKVIPQNLDIEAALIGCLLNNGLLYPDVVEGSGLAEKDFYDQRHAVIFKTILDIYEEKRTPDVLTVIDRIRKTPFELDEAYVYDLANNAPVISDASLQEYCDTIIEKSLLREMIHLCGEVADASYNQQEPFEDIADRATTKLINLSNRRQSQDIKSLEELVPGELELIMKAKGGITGITSGYEQLDRYSSGLKPGDMVILAGRPSMGKTSLAMNMALEIAKKGLNVLFFSLEMAASQLVKKLISIECGIESGHLLNGALDSEEKKRLVEIGPTLWKLPIFLDESSYLTIADIRSKAKKLDDKLRKTLNTQRTTPNRLDCIFIDYLQLISATIYKEDRVRQVEYVSKNIKLFAKDMGIPIVALAQLNRRIEERASKNTVPLLSDLKDSGSIEQDADMVMFIHRPDFYKPVEERKNDAEIWVQKNRLGQTGKVSLRFVPKYTKFSPIDPSEQDN